MTGNVEEETPRLRILQMRARQEMKSKRCGTEQREKLKVDDPQSSDPITQCQSGAPKTALTKLMEADSQDMFPEPKIVGALAVATGTEASSAWLGPLVAWKFEGAGPNLPPHRKNLLKRVVCNEAQVGHLAKACSAGVLEDRRSLQKEVFQRPGQQCSPIGVFSLEHLPNP
ncbi:hypothetical protein H920_05072 [Fukomys damarensis]|uniref:Uncharacterized protein n=1 Tax=Fukomys damarensis TaxID=885580 RepID=A0A091DTC5_FUKDA|nr:hypothetical protein H920_05072 [Fukomys damarensis]